MRSNIKAKYCVGKIIDQDKKYQAENRSWNQGEYFVFEKYAGNKMNPHKQPQTCDQGGKRSNK